jgi:acetyl-CoA synthetase
MSSVSEFLNARNYLFAHRSVYDAALRGFSWPRMDGFNWAFNYFDVIAGDNGTALASEIR